MYRFLHSAFCDRAASLIVVHAIVICAGFGSWYGQHQQFAIRLISVWSADMNEVENSEGISISNGSINQNHNPAPVEVIEGSGVHYLGSCVFVIPSIFI